MNPNQPQQMKIPDNCLAILEFCVGGMMMTHISTERNPQQLADSISRALKDDGILVLPGSKEHNEPAMNVNIKHLLWWRIMNPPSKILTVRPNLTLDKKVQ